MNCWRGYWPGALVEGVSLEISPQSSLESPPQMLPKIADNDTWLIALAAHSGCLSDMISGFGVDPLTTNGFDPAYDQPEPPLPPAGDFIRLYFPHPEWGVILGDKFNRDIQTPLTANEIRSWNFEVQCKGSVQLSWDSISVEGHLFTLVELDANITTNMIELSGYNYTTENEIRHFRIDVSTGLSDNIGDEQDDLPKEYALAQNYPNPFNPQTEIRYHLPKAGEISIIVYNHLGQKVRTLVTAHMPAGCHQDKWDGENDAGQRMASGIYFYKLRVDDAVLASKRMILLK